RRVVPGTPWQDRAPPGHHPGRGSRVRRRRCLHRGHGHMRRDADCAWPADPSVRVRPRWWCQVIREEESRPGDLTGAAPKRGNAADKPSVNAALSAARYLAEHGVPVFIAKAARDKDTGEWIPDGGDGGTGYKLPS